MKKTPLYEKHVALEGKVIDFGGWALPVQYTGIIQEHEMVRTSSGLFDVSHMGEILVEGRESSSYVQKVITNDISNMTVGQVIYSLMCYEDGGVVDDLLVYKTAEDKYFLVVNASNVDKDFEWMLKHVDENVTVQNVSNEYAQLALQGPKAQEILQKLTDEPLGDIKFFRFKSEVSLVGKSTLVSRTGYTGEDGFEIYLAPDDAPAVWQAILDEGKDAVQPIGLGARDTLRFEAGLPLYGHEISADITPLEAKLGFFVKLEKAGFIGQKALQNQKSEGLSRRLVGLELLGRGLPREGYDIKLGQDNIGFVTTGSYAPSFKKSMAMALVDSAYAKKGLEMDVVIRNKPVKAVTIPLPFYKKRYKK